jgi:RND family efflux transporter MFP subunit
LNRIHIVLQLAFQLLTVIFAAAVVSGAAWAQSESADRQLDATVPFTDRLKVSSGIRALLVPQREATLSSLVAARIGKIHVQQGDRFNQGDVLVSFECDVLRARLQTARARRKQHRLTYEVNRDLRKRDAVSKLDLALSEAKLEEGNAEVVLAEAQLRKCNISAPYDGRVVKVTANEFENVEVGDQLLSILDDTNLEMTLHIASRWLKSVGEKTKFNVKLDETGKTYRAQITRISPRIDPTSRTFEVTARIIDGHEELLAGMSGNAIFGFQK